MYSIQYWNERDAQWRGTGSGSFYDLSHARSRMRSLSQQCDFCVRFRIEDTSVPA